MFNMKYWNTLYTPRKTNQGNSSSTPSFLAATSTQNKFGRRIWSWCVLQKNNFAVAQIEVKRNCPKEKQCFYLMLFFWHPLILDFSPGLSLHTLLWNVAWCKRKITVPKCLQFLQSSQALGLSCAKKQEIMISPPSNLQIMKGTCVPKTGSRLKHFLLCSIYPMHQMFFALCSFLTAILWPSIKQCSKLNSDYSIDSMVFQSC